MKTKRIIKRCTKCGEEKPLSEFYPRGAKYYVSNCKACLMVYRKDHIVEKIKSTPNTYVSESQRMDTFKVMSILGWSFNPDNGVWYKDGVKDKSGKWLYSPVN